MEVTIKNFNLSTISNSGQCFRLNEISNNHFVLIFKNKILEIKYLGNNKFDFNCSKKDFDIYKNYFDLDVDYNKYLKVCLKDDYFLKKCIKYSSGMKILKQDYFETLISFIISQRKSIRAIKTSIEKLCRVSGNKINNEYYSFPTPLQIINTDINLLLNCGFGYRLPYILEASKKVHNKEIDLNKIAFLSSKDLFNELLKFKGVGIKVASCVMLFAYHRIDFCPVDVWIDKVIQNVYNNNIPKEYEKYLGIIQQYWFNYIHIYKDFSKIEK